MKTVLCTVSAAPLRKEPSHRSEMTSQLLFGEMAGVLEQQQEWLRIKCRYDGYEGWITHHLISVVEDRIATAPLQFVSTALLNDVLLGTELFQIPMGCSLTGYNEKSHRLWDERYTYNGSSRNIQQPYTSALFHNTIHPWLHAPYLWGGKTFMGVDCSGFVQTVFKVLGVPLLRDAYQQAEQGTAVAGVEQAQAGDLAFFNNEAGRITHVGIVLEGNNIIHASGTVHIDRLTNEGIFTTADNQQTHHLHSIRRVIHFSN